MTVISGIKHFCLEELVDPSYIQIFGSGAIRYIDRELLLDLDQLSEDIGGIIVNNYSRGGRLSESGLRRLDTATGAKLSLHKYGKAFDCHPLKLSPQELYKHILDNRKKYPSIMRMEDITKTPGWVHIDSGWHPNDLIMIVQP